VKIPDTLFNGCTNISNISYCFSNFGIPFELTPNGFKDTKLSNAEYLFYQSTNCQSQFPSNFFNMGFVDKPALSITGATINLIPLDVPGNAQTR
jgi:hypothetical protein